MSYCNVDDQGTIRWYGSDDGLAHREDDFPAVIWSDGDQEWWKSDELHRDGDLPAIIYADKTQEFYKNGYRYSPQESQ